MSGVTPWTIERLRDPADVERLAALETSSFRRPADPGDYARQITQSPIARVYVLRTDDLPVAAYCACWLLFDELHVNMIAVDPACRGRGMATALMQFVLTDALEQGATRATLEVRASNEAARRLYDKLGFTVRAVRRGYYSNPVEDGLILWRDEPHPAATGTS